ncbi:MAG: hypothetical protein P4L77_05175 [Sulfuriferula sp.]|nr:hypothetical protein [Sulfuriferula sp.]
MKILLILILMFMINAIDAAPLKIISSCQMNDNTQTMLLAKASAEGNRFYLQIDGKLRRAFTDMPNTDFVGDVATTKCDKGLFIFAITYGPPYLKGVVIRKNPVTHIVERIDFAEKALPLLVYFNNDMMRLVIPNLGNEVNTKYLVYDFHAGKGQDNEAHGVNFKPATMGFSVLQLNH